MSDPVNHEDQREHGRRVEAILGRARRETGVRDLLTFSFVKMWTALLAVGAVFCVLFGKWYLQPKAGQENSTRPSNPTTSK